MERLTYMDGGKWRIRIGDTEYSGKEIDRFASYEDTGLEPETISKIRDIVLDISGDLDRLRDLVKADWDGRCFISDVKLGDEVFYIPKYNGKSLDGIKKGHVQAILFTRAGKRVKLREYREFNKDFMLGKTAFTTREAAEKALEEEKHG